MIKKNLLGLLFFGFEHDMKKQNRETIIMKKFIHVATYLHRYNTTFLLFGKYWNGVLNVPKDCFEDIDFIITAKQLNYGGIVYNKTISLVSIY